MFCAVGDDAREQMLLLVVDAWVQAMPARALDEHFSKTVRSLAGEELEALAAYLQDARVIDVAADVDALEGAFGELGDARRHALAHAARLRAEEALPYPAVHETILDTVLPSLGAGDARALAQACTSVYCSDRLGMPVADALRA